MMEMPGEFSSTTSHALQDAVLSPRFYTTDFAAIDRINIDHMRDEFDWIRDEFAHDYNKGHFVRTDEFQSDFESMPELSLFVEFLERSCTAEFSGCLLYAEMFKHLHNPTMRNIFKYMSRDEGRHAGFLNKTMTDLHVPMNLSVLQKRKKYTYFKPKFIFYATYLSEKIGYARYIEIYRHLQRHPEGTIHPIFKWFEKWCNDEYRHGEFFSILMRSQPQLLRGANVRWVRFFLLAVCATMYINDSRRASFYNALGMDWRAYDQRVIRLTNEITTQVFPVTLPVDNPLFYKHLDACVGYDRRIAHLAHRSDPLAKSQSALLRAATGARLFAAYRLPPVPTTDANRWKGLAGFPNYPGPLRERTAVAG